MENIKRYKITLVMIAVLFVASASLQMQAQDSVFVRDFFEQAGYQVDWDQEANAVLLAGESGNIRIVVGSDQFEKNGEFFPLHTPLIIVDSRAVLPIDAILEIFDTLDVLDTFDVSVGDFRDIAFITADSTEERNRMWQADLEQLREAIIQRHGMFWDDSTIFVPGDALGEDDGQFIVWMDIPRSEALRSNTLAAFDELINNVPYLSDFEIAVGMQSAVSNLQDNHFRVFPYEIMAADVSLFIDFRHFGGAGGGFYLIGVLEEFSHALNYRITAINEVPIGIVMERFSRFMSLENIYDIRVQLGRVLHSTLMLEILGLREGGTTTFTLESDGNTTEITLTQAHEIHFYEDMDFSFITSQMEGDMPAFLAMDGRNNFHFFEDHGLLYIRIEGFDPTVFIDGWDLMHELGAESFSEIEDELRQAIAQGDIQGVITPPANVGPAYWLDDEFRFSWDVHFGILDIIEENDVQAIVIDARLNVGGDPAPFFELFQLAADTVEEGRLFYFIDGGSYSAAVTSAMAMAYLGAVIVGEPTGQNTIFYGVLSGIGDERDPHIFLNYSQLAIEIPNLLSHAAAEDIGPNFDPDAFFNMSPYFEFYTFRPDVLIEHTIEHWINNTDPLLEYVISRRLYLEGVVFDE
ncbi:MAG: copper amine oxidase N-terminal domain-containing protein [Defluviitaleaceae bacterium]|nr:copper amine oxidase N-terminal domain-containing protein [Defluviitaleaceae bacterium]